MYKNKNKIIEHILSKEFPNMHDWCVRWASIEMREIVTRGNILRVFQN